MYLNTDTYSCKNLNDKDKAVAAELEEAKDIVLNDENLDEYLEQQFGSASFTAQVVREQLIPFLDFLKKKWDYCVCDKIIDSVDGYSEEEFETIVKSNEERKRVQ